MAAWRAIKVRDIEEEALERDLKTRKSSQFLLKIPSNKNKARVGPRPLASFKYIVDFEGYKFTKETKILSGAFIY